MNFAEKKERLDRQFEQIEWVGGLPYEELKAQAEALERELCAQGLSRPIQKARVFAYLLQHGQLAVDAEDIFSDKLNARGIIGAQKNRWLGEIYQGPMKSERERVSRAFRQGAYRADHDFGHTSPNSEALLNLGLPGLIERLHEARARHASLTAEQADFYRSCEIMLSAICDVARRMADLVRPTDPERAACLEHIASGKPQNTYEALQLLWLYFYMHEYIGDTRVRTLGFLDAILTPFYLRDLETGLYTKEDIAELLRFFLNKIWSAKVPYDLPLSIGGEQVNELSALIVEIYNELNIHSPKIHVNLTETTPESFLRQVLSCIRGGNSSFLLVNTPVAIRTLEKVGIPYEDAKNVIMIGCYEPAVNGVEIGCTGTASVSLPKAVEFVFTSGKDWQTGEAFGLPTDLPQTYEAFAEVVRAQIKHMADAAMDFVCRVEQHYPAINPDPILSAMYEHCVETGVDAYSAGAKYNNSSLNFVGIATLVDSLLALKKLVYEQKRVTIEQMREILLSNWERADDLRTAALKLGGKYGNGDPEADALTREWSAYVAGLVNHHPNGRGGVFKTGLYSIDRCFTYGEVTMATPDGRLAGEALSKNLCAVTAMDKKGITALIRSVTQIDMTEFANGTVLDVLLHPSAVRGEDGMAAMVGLVKAYFAQGGFAMHGNVFDSSILRKAQADPQKYATLQVRLCGWNVFFADLTRQEQDAFIKQSEG